MPLSTEEKRQRRIARMHETLKQYRLTRCVAMTAAAMQRAIRAEYATLSVQTCMRDGRYIQLESALGCCVCVTCGEIKPWQGAKGLGIDGIDAGHFLGGRCNAILFDERGVHPQCTYCNRNGGYPEAYQSYMLNRYGQGVVDELKRLKAQARVTFDRLQLAEMRVDYLDRTRAAEKRMG